MDFKTRIKFYILAGFSVILLIPFLVSAQTYLFVSVEYNHPNDTGKIISVDQRNITGPGLGTQGEFDIRLTDSQNKTVAKNNFVISSDAVESLGSAGGVYSVPKYSAITVPVLLDTADPSGLMLVFEKGNKIYDRKNLSALSVDVLSKGNAPANINTESSYLFHLYYDNGQLFADRDVQFKYDVIPEKFVPEILNTGFPYKGEIINLNNQVAVTFQFDPKHGDPKFVKGAISVKGPYVPDGQKAVFYDAQGNQLLSISVSESSFCNDDGICNSDRGEDTKTCPSDCKSGFVTPAPTATPAPSASATRGIVNGIIYLVIGLGIGGGFWYYLKKKSKPSGMDLPPSNPSSPSNT